VLAAPGTFDLILSDSIHPKYLGNGFLYTKEYFELVRARLAPGGACSMWLPMYSLTPKNFKEILGAFTAVFPQTTVWWFPEPSNAFTVVMGGLKPLSLETLKSGLEEPKVARELADVGLTSWEAVAAGCVLGPDGVARMTAGVAPHSDDRPTVEYESNRIFAKSSTWGLNLREIHAYRETPAEIFGPAPVPPRLESLASRYEDIMRRQILALMERPRTP
jgi:spermidine synthase